MIPLILWTSAVAQAPNATLLESTTAEQCRSAMASKLGLNIGSVAVSSAKHANGSTVIQGTFSGYRPPAPPGRGMAAPLHVIDVRYLYRCWLRHGVVRHVWTHKVAE